MLKSVDAAILMKTDLRKITVLTEQKIDNLGEYSRYSNKIFDTEVINFLDSLSKLLFKDSRIKEYPDVGTFAFYCRKGNIRKLYKNYSGSEKNRFGRGCIFHIAPSNVPVNFAYSLVAGLLSGNVNIVKVPSKPFEQIQMIVEAINQVAQSDGGSVSKKIHLIRYDTDDVSITDQLSLSCNVRIIWGGDETIKEVRQSPLTPRSFDITFSDRYSICVLNASKIISEKHLDRLMIDFYNDTYLFDQNACTAPHLLIWLGENKEVEDAQNIFWDRLHEVVKEKYNLQPIQAMDKITTFYNQSALMKGIVLNDFDDNYLWRVNLNNLEKSLESFRGNSGYFNEYHANSLEEIVPIVNSKYQTLAYFGLEKEIFEKFISENVLQGIDRIVPVGRTTDFSLIWDGYDLINQLSREIEII